MKALIIFAHPNPQSFNAAVLGTVKEELGKKGAEVKVKDLYAMQWNPVLSAADFQQMLSGKIPDDIAHEQADVTWADTLIIVSPIWWYSFPAILKGYIDRVLGQGFAYEYTESGPRGLLTGKRAAVITTSGADENTAKQTGMMDAINTSIVKGIFTFCGFSDMKYHNNYAVPMVPAEERQKMLEQVSAFVKAL